MIERHEHTWGGRDWPKIDYSNIKNTPDLTQAEWKYYFADVSFSAPASSMTIATLTETDTNDSAWMWVTADKVTITEDGRYSIEANTVWNNISVTWYDRETWIYINWTLEARDITVPRSPWWSYNWVSILANLVIWNTIEIKVFQDSAATLWNQNPTTLQVAKI